MITHPIPENDLALPDRVPPLPQWKRQNFPITSGQEATTRTSVWNYLVPRPHTGRMQLFLKGRNVSAATIWLDMHTNDLTRDEAAANWDLPLEAIAEIEAYCTQARPLLEREAEEERLHLLQNGVTLTR